MFYLGKTVVKSVTGDVVNPYDQSVVGRVGLTEPRDVAAIIETAEKGFGRARKMSARERARILEQASSLILARQEDFARTITRETGKTINEARAEVDRAAATLKLSALAGLSLAGETVRFDLGGPTTKTGYYTRVPLGVVLAISPFNFPLNLSCHKIGPAIAAGNSVIHKPATKTPLSAIMLAQALVDAGLPVECLTVAVGPGSSLGAQLVKLPAVRKISLTGSLEAGEAIMAQCGLKRVTMELGANSAVVVFRDAPLELVASKIRRGGYTLAGQVCISVQRVYVEEAIADEFLRALALEVGQIKYGDPMLEETEMGPMIDAAALEKAAAFCADAKKHSGIVILGGRSAGTIFLPTIIFDVREEAMVIQEEAFAPIVAVNKFSTDDEMLAKVNNTKYGLQTGVFTRDLNRALRCSQEIEAGSVLINEIPTFRVDNMPYGGTKCSGIGREGPAFTIREMTEEKLVIFDRLDLPA